MIIFMAQKFVYSLYTYICSVIIFSIRSFKDTSVYTNLYVLYSICKVTAVIMNISNKSCVGS